MMSRYYIYFRDGCYNHCTNQIKQSQSGFNMPPNYSIFGRDDELRLTYGWLVGRSSIYSLPKLSLHGSTL
jgi:hypothetical protein